jgi:two-component system, cell cycle response regulator
MADQTTIMVEQALNGLPPDNQEKPVILIADDSRVVRVSLKKILKNDCQLIEAEDGQQAWELLLEHPHISLIFSELSMPRLDGRSLLNKIRQSEINRIRNLPFIVVTGNKVDAVVRQQLQDSGATEMVRKPFDPASIVSFVNTLVTRQEDESYFILPDEQNQTHFLPGISNQSQFMEGASKELSFAIRNKNELAIALLKIDQFDTISSHYSDPAVEHILLSTAEIIRQHIHPDDTIAYFGEGVYAILRPASNAIGTRYIGRRIIEDLTAKQFYLGETDETVSASIGISAPNIKQGTRLRELLLLAEGRLKAAIDLGGKRVIDKGNDTLTPISTLVDASQDLTTQAITSSKTDAESSVGHRPYQPATERHSAHSESDPAETLKQLADLNKRLDQLADENQDLQAQVDRWRKQSAESEQLRQRVFELESEQQQIQLKLNSLQTENTHFKQRAEVAESEKQQLIESENERTITLKQSSQFYEEENLRLEGLVDALSNRAQKAELANRKSEQLILSLKDNIALLRGQLEQVQAQLSEAKRSPAPERPATPATAASANTASVPLESPSQPLEASDSDLLFDGFPSSGNVVKEKAPVLQIFPKKQSTPRPPKALEPASKNLSIPVYRVEDERQPLPRERRPLSSFNIAMLILFIMLALGCGLIYHYMQATSGTIAVVGDHGSPAASSRDNGVAQPTSQPDKPNTEAKPTIDDAPPSADTSPQEIAARTSIMSVLPQAPSTLTEEAKLEAEQTLRQIAEEEFNQQLHQINDDQKQPDQTQPQSGQAPDGEAVTVPASEIMAENPSDNR